jgi:hypothetical protein
LKAEAGEKIFFFGFGRAYKGFQRARPRLAAQYGKQTGYEIFKRVTANKSELWRVDFGDGERRFDSVVNAAGYHFPYFFIDRQAVLTLMFRAVI